MALPTGKMPADPSLIFVRQCLLLEHDLKAQGSRSHSSFTISMPVGERRRAIPDAICELMLGCATAFKAGPPVICLPAPAGWWSQTESNRRHPACKAGALPTELWPRSRERCEAQESCRRCRLEAENPQRTRSPGRPGQTRTADLTLIRRTL